MTNDPPQVVALELFPNQGETIRAASTMPNITTINAELGEPGNDGWLLLNPVTFVAIWYGGPSIDSLHIHFMSEDPYRMVSSNFGYGILTWNPRHIFKTHPGWNLHVRGPVNHPKRGVVALEGIVETDWAESTFTMNWQITEPGHPIVFQEGEPFCFITPSRRGALERFSPVVSQISEIPEGSAAHIGAISDPQTPTESKGVAYQPE